MFFKSLFKANKGLATRSAPPPKTGKPAEPAATPHPSPRPVGSGITVRKRNDPSRTVLIVATPNPATQPGGLSKPKDRAGKA